MPAMRTGLPFESRIWFPLVCQYPAPTPCAGAAPGLAAAPAAVASGSSSPPAASTAAEPAAASAAASCLRLPHLSGGRGRGGGGAGAPHAGRRSPASQLSIMIAFLSGEDEAMP